VFCNAVLQFPETAKVKSAALGFRFAVVNTIEHYDDEDDFDDEQQHDPTLTSLCEFGSASARR